MAFTKTERTNFMVGQIIVMMLVAMHIVTGIKGYEYFKDHVQPSSKMPGFLLLIITYQQYEARLIMLMAVAGLTFLTNLACVWLLYNPKRMKWLQHITVFNLVIEVGVGLLLAISLYEMSLTRDFYIQYVYKTSQVANNAWDGDGFNVFWRILISDLVLTFVPQVLFLIFFYVKISDQSRNESYLEQLTNDDASGYNKA